MLNSRAIAGRHAAHKDLYAFGPHAVGEDVRRSRDDKLTGIGTRPACPAAG
jgi:hypothetical protein